MISVTMADLAQVLVAGMALGLALGLLAALPLFRVRVVRR